MRIVGLLFGILFLSTLTSAQDSKWQAGYVILNNADTLRGEIEFINWNRNPTNLQFKTSAGQVKTFKVAELRAFAIPEKASYERANIRYNALSKSNELLRKDKEVVWKADTVWLEVLWMSDVKLYRFFEPITGEHFLMASDTIGLEELLQYKYIQTTTDEDKAQSMPAGGQVRRLHQSGKTIGDNIIQRKPYKNQLKKFLYDCQSLFDKIDRTDLSERSLLQLMQSYQKCQGQTATFQKKKLKTGLEFSLFGGVALAQVKREGASITNATDNSVGPNLGISLEFVFQRNQKAFSIFSELAYRSYDGILFAQEAPFPPFDKFVLTSELKYLRLSVGARRTLINRRVKLLAGAGLSNGFLLRDELQIEDEFRGHEQGIFLDLMATYGNLGLGIRHERSNGYSPAVAIDTKVAITQFYLTYRLWKNEGGRG